MQIARKFESFISRKLRLSRAQNKRKLCEEMSDNFRTWQGMNVAFGNRTEKVDWRRLASTDIGKIKREMDYKTLQDNIMHITFCNIESEMGMYGGPLDPNFVKLFQLSQLIIEYLLHSQEFLSASLDETCKKAEKDLENAKENKMLLEKKTEACHKQKKEIRRLKKWIAEYQLLMRAGASGLHKCPMCDKSFVSQEYLIGHVNRRHQISQQSNGLQMSGFQKPQSEQKQSLQPAVSGIEKSVLMDELSQIKERLQVTEQDLMNERNARETLIQRERDQQLKQDAKVQEIEEKYEKWKVFEGKKHQREMDGLKNSLMQELQELQEQKDSVTQVLSELQEQARVRPSMLGTLKDEDEPDFSRRLDRDEIAEVMKEQFNVELNKLVAQNKQEMQKELQKLNQKWKKKEENIQREHETEMTKLQNLLGQYEQSFHAERNEKEVLTREYEHLRKKVQDHDKALNTQRDMKEKLEQSIQRQQQQLNALSPPTVPRRETTFTLDNTPALMERPKTPIQEEIQFRERAKTPSQAGEMILLHVSCNESRNQYRLWRERSNTSKEWTDMFSFSAASQPSEQFMAPVYVYSSGGSPYWRQFISACPKPPSSEYRMDYMFFVSSSPGPGMVQLHVLDSGSVPVIKSCVLKSNNLPGWKDKGLSFYVIKSSMASKTAMSASLDSTLESAAVNENPDKSFHESESEAESEEEDVMEESKNVYESSGSASQSLEDSREMTSVLSSSEWGTTLPEVGEFRPYPNNPYITTRFNHKPPVLQVCRQEIVEVIERKLEKQGIAPGVQQLSSQKMEARMSALNHERQTRAKKMKGSDENRQSCAQRLEEIARKTYNRGSSTKPSVAGEAVSRPLPSIQQPDTLNQSRPPTLKAAGQAARMSFALQQPNRNQLRTSQTLSSTGSSGGDATLTATSVTDRSSFTATSVTDHTLSESEGEDEDEEDEEDLNGSGESDDSNWDNSISDEGIENTAVPRLAVHIPTQTGIKTREPRGEKVRELTASLERNLSIGRDVKKPAGAVSLFNDQGPGQQRTAITNDDLDDDSDFSITSMEEDKRPSPTPRTITGAKMSSTYNPPPRSQPQPVARPRTLTPSTRPDQQQTSAVTAFTFDDDDFDDDDLDIHHLT